MTFQPRIAGLKERITRVTTQRQVLVEAAEAERGLALVVGRVEDFAAKIHRRLDELDWQGTREIIRSLVRRIEIDGDAVEVVFRIPSSLPGAGLRDQAQSRAALLIGNMVGALIIRSVGALMIETRNEWARGGERMSAGGHQGRRGEPFMPIPRRRPWRLGAVPQRPASMPRLSCATLSVAACGRPWLDGGR